MGIVQGTTIRAMKGDTRSLDNGSYRVRGRMDKTGQNNAGYYLGV